MPNFGSNVETIQWHDPNSARAATTRSPAFRWDSIAAFTAAMPVAVVRQASAPSIRHSRSSSIVSVGLAKREY